MHLVPRLIRLFTVFLLSVVCLQFSVSTSRAHEFIVVPDEEEYAPGAALPFSVYSTHIFVKGEELEPLPITTVSYLGQPVALKGDPDSLTYRGSVKSETSGAAIIEGHRLPVIWSETAESEGEGGRSVFPDALRSTCHEKFVKVVLPVGGETAGYDREVGHRLELVPLDNPLTAVPGDEIKFKVLLDGRLTAFDAVKATYAGFTDIPDAWAFTASPTAHGEATVRLSSKGVWLVQVSVSLEEKTDEYDDVRLKSILVFPVQ